MRQGLPTECAPISPAQDTLTKARPQWQADLSQSIQHHRQGWTGAIVDVGWSLRAGPCSRHQRNKLVLGHGWVLSLDEG
jgi:hypothetical protein